MNTAYVETMKVLLEKAIETCVDAEHHSGTLGLSQLQNLRLKLTIAMGTLNALGRGRGGQLASPPPG